MPIKTEEQLDLQALHRVRERWVMRRTAVVNQIRSLLLERGLTVPKGRSHLEQALPRILEDATLNLSGSFRVLLAQLQLELEQLAARIEPLDLVLQQKARENEACQRLTTIPGVGPVTATALIGAIGNGSAFRKGRDLSAWMGIVRANTRPVASRGCWASANAAINIYADCSCKAPAACCNSAKSRLPG